MFMEYEERSTKTSLHSSTERSDVCLSSLHYKWLTYNTSTALKTLPCRRVIHGITEYLGLEGTSNYPANCLGLCPVQF